MSTNDPPTNPPHRTDPIETLKGTTLAEFDAALTRG